MAFLHSMYLSTYAKDDLKASSLFFSSQNLKERPCEKLLLLLLLRILLELGKMVLVL
jgi:hypothetical protein